MIQNYRLFTDELLLESAINESRIYYTIEFRKTLHKVNHEIAKRLLEVEFDDVKPDMTLIDLSGKEDSITFAQMPKVIAALKKIADEVGAKYNIDKEVFQKNIEKISGKIENGTISSSEIDFIFNNADYNLKSRSRNEAKMSKLVNSIFPGEYTDAEGQKKMREFLSKYAAVVSGKAEEENFKLIEGEEIRARYNKENYSAEKGELGESCMRYAKCGKYLDIYVKNPGVCKLLVLVDHEDKVLGRALIWKLNSISIDPMPEYYMDRIYAVDDSVKESFKEYADRKGWLKRLTSRYNDSKDFMLGSEAHMNKSASIQLAEWDFDKYPYMDTFKRLGKNTSMLFNDDEQEKNCYIMTNTDGTYNDCSGYWSEWNEQYIPQNDAVWSDPADSWIYRDDAYEVNIGSQRYRGWWPNDENLVFDPFREEYIHTNNAIWSEYLSEYFYEDDQIELITSVEGGNKDRLDMSVDVFSEVQDVGIAWRSMMCKDYLIEIGELRDFHEEILGYNEEGKYYVSDFKTTLYKTEKGEYSDIDCAILGIDRKGAKTKTTDAFDYNFNLENKEEIMEKAQAKIKELGDIIEGKQTRLEFEDDKEYIDRLKRLRNDLINRSETLEEWI